MNPSGSLPILSIRAQHSIHAGPPDPAWHTALIAALAIPPPLQHTAMLGLTTAADDGQPVVHQFEIRRPF